MAEATRDYRESANVARPGQTYIGQGRSKLGYWFEDVKRRARGIATASKRLSSRELAERTTGMLGAGVLKPMAVSHIIGKGARIIRNTQAAMNISPKQFHPEGTLAPWVTETLRAPQKELSRVSSIYPRRSLGMGVHGQYTPSTREISLSMEAPKSIRASTIWHELTHGRQWKPSQQDMVDKLFETRKRILKAANAAGNVSAKTFYDFLDPIEIQARSMGAKMTQPKRSGRVVSQLLYDSDYWGEMERSISRAIRNARIRDLL